MAEGAGDYRSVVRRVEKLQRRWEASMDEEEQALPVNWKSFCTS